MRKNIRAFALIAGKLGRLVGMRRGEKLQLSSFVSFLIFWLTKQDAWCAGWNSTLACVSSDAAENRNSSIFINRFQSLASDIGSANCRNMSAYRILLRSSLQKPVIWFNAHVGADGPACKFFATKCWEPSAKKTTDTVNQSIINHFLLSAKLKETPDD